MEQLDDVVNLDLSIELLILGVVALTLDLVHICTWRMTRTPSSESP